MNQTNKSEGIVTANIKLTDVIDIQFLQQFQDDFAKGMGLASVTVDLDGQPITNPSHYTRFCDKYTHSTECGDNRCAESHLRGGQEAARLGKPYVYECHAGLIDFAAPIMLEGNLIGTILGGQVLTNEPEEAKYRKIASEIGVDPDKYVEAAKEVYILTRERIEAAANVLFIVANNMSQSWYYQQKLKNSSSMLNDNLTEISATMEQLAASASNVSNDQATLNKEVQEVSKVSEQINNVLDFIKEIADETRLLGLNAAIEAARAGEAGLGFGVVAQEIRKLSADSKQTVGKIKELTTHIQKSVQKTVTMSDSTMSTVEQQAAGIQEVTASVEEMVHLAAQLMELAKQSK